jgi:cytochrome c peroxidase
MKRLLLHPVMVTFISVVLITLLPIVIKQGQLREYSDSELRHMALSRGMLPTPTSYKELLKIVDNPVNPLTPDKIALGKELFFDSNLSRSRDINCATCHILEQGGDDNVAVAVGYHGRENPFHLNSPTVLNAALAKAQFWNGSAKDVEEQAGGPIQAPFEMNLTPKEVVERLNSTKEYQAKFKAVFNDKISFKRVKDAIGAYERTLLTYGAYDKFLNGDNKAISTKAKRGMALFFTQGCIGCHNGISVGGQSIERFPLRESLLDTIGVILNPNVNIKESPFPFENVGGFLGQDGNLKFRVPILRNIVKTAPYFHNGAEKEIKEVVRIMSKYQLGNEFTPKQIDEVVEFLKTLTGELVEYDIK